MGIQHSPDGIATAFARVVALPFEAQPAFARNGCIEGWRSSRIISDQWIPDHKQLTAGKRAIVNRPEGWLVIGPARDH